MPDLTDPTAVRPLLARHAFRFSKALGQNFIIDPSVCPRMAGASGAGPGVGVLEVGPGIGTLTAELAKRADRVVAVERDARLLPVLGETMRGFPGVEVILGDAMRTDFKKLIRERFGGLRVVFAANLPYYLTSPLLLRLLEERLPLDAVTVMVQREAGRRITAPPGTRECGAVSAAVAYYTRAETLFPVGARSFFPEPAVDSSVIRLIPRAAPPVDVPSEAAFFALVRAGFRQRRKTLCNALSAALSLPKAAVRDLLAGAGLPDPVRAEQLTLEDWGRLARRAGPL